MTRDPFFGAPRHRDQITVVLDQQTTFVGPVGSVSGSGGVVSIGVTLHLRDHHAAVDKVPFMLNVADEGRTWIRGAHAPGSEEANALIAASALVLGNTPQ